MADYSKKLIVEPDSKVKLYDFDPAGHLSSAKGAEVARDAGKRASRRILAAETGIHCPLGAKQ